MVGGGVVFAILGKLFEFKVLLFLQVGDGVDIRQNLFDVELGRLHIFTKLCVFLIDSGLCSGRHHSDGGCESGAKVYSG